jgi:spore coat-associated protein N
VSAHSASSLVTTAAHATTGQDPTLRRRLYSTALVLLLFGSLSTVGVLALFTDSEAVGANAFSTGTIDISTSPSTALVAFSGMMPGDSVTNPLVVTNGGGAARYSVASSATNTDAKGLKDQLVLTIKTGVTACTNAGFATDGTQLYTGDLDSSAGKLIGDVAQGADSGDRALAVSASETLCFKVSLPLATGNAFTSAASTATFTFDAEQTANN